MVFNGTFAATKRAISKTATSVENITNVEVGNAVYDNLYMTNASTILQQIPDDWDINTLMWAKFDGTTSAGNLDYMLEQINAIRIKRKLKDEGDWITMFEIPVSGVDDLTFVLYDRYVQHGRTYEYALVPVVDTIEVAVLGHEVTASFDGLYITDGQETYHTYLNSSIESYQRNHGGNAVETLAGKYPYRIKNSAVNYDSGRAQGLFLPMNSDGCSVTTQGSFDYRRAFVDFLLNGRAKIIKDSYGQIWMTHIVDDPSVTFNGHPAKTIVAFNWAEVGDVNSQQDLYDNGFISVAPHITGA